MTKYRPLNISKRRIVFITGTAILFALTIWLLNQLAFLADYWSSFETYRTIETDFCEKTFMHKFVRQPINTFSNFVYFMVAVALLRRGWKDQNKRQPYNLVSANPFYSIVFGLILLYTFIASTIFHSSLLIFTNKLDYSAVYSMSLFPLMYFTHRLWLLQIAVPSNQKHSKSTTTVITVFSVLYVVCTFFLPTHIGKIIVLFILGLLVLFGVYVERKAPGHTNHRYMVVCILSILFAVMWFAFDVYKVFCDSNSFIQPHSLWHLFAGISAFYFYMYIRSERNKLA
ncbi:MAG: ceramidase domain-containing protein [Chitinophagales bacterium]|nr:ceramidase domain-containing protein [Chitinophagales bacterium]